MQELEIEKRFYIPEEKIDEIRAYIMPNSSIYMNDFLCLTEKCIKISGYVKKATTT